VSAGARHRLRFAHRYCRSGRARRRRRAAAGRDVHARAGNGHAGPAFRAGRRAWKLLAHEPEIEKPDIGNARVPGLADHHHRRSLRAICGSRRCACHNRQRPRSCCLPNLKPTSRSFGGDQRSRFAGRTRIKPLSRSLDGPRRRRLWHSENAAATPRQHSLAPPSLPIAVSAVQPASGWPLAVPAEH
jgi:hypothetical protein